MQKDSLQRPYIIGLIQWLCLTALIMLICSSVIYSEQSQPGAVFESPEVSQFSLHFRIEEKYPVILPHKMASSGSSENTKNLFGSIIQKAADFHKVDPALVKAVIMAESGYNPKAVSKKGAKGLMQLMPKTAEALGVEDSFNPEDNIYAGVEYLKKLLNRFEGDVTLALAAYNAGSRKVRKYQGVPPFRATKYYIKKVLKFYQVYKEQEKVKTGIT